MLNKEAIEAISEGTGITQASDAFKKAFGDKAVVALPERFKKHDLETYLPNRRRVRGLMSTLALKDFAAYAKSNQEEGAAVFIDAEEMAAVAVLNLGTTSKPGHADNKARLKLKRTAAYSALLSVAQGRHLSQAMVAEFFEDWTENLL